MSKWSLSHRDAEYFARTLREQRRNELREGLRLNWPTAHARYEEALAHLGYTRDQALTEEQTDAVLDKALITE
jgi:hypothetical protein